MRHTDYMRLALAEAARAAQKGEIPVGAVLVKDGKVIASGHNLRETNRSAAAHAEMLVIEQGCKALGRWRLSDCTLYVTLEPCPMCMGAVINARVKTVVFGAYDPKAGCCDSVCDFTRLPFNHRPEVVCGILQEECGRVLSDFFAARRQEERDRKA